MAYSVSFIKKTVVGDMRMFIMSCVADAATEAIDSGLDSVYGFTLAPRSCSTAALKVFQNYTALGTASAGYMGVSGAVSGDEFILTVYGK